MDQEVDLSRALKWFEERGLKVELTRQEKIKLSSELRWKSAEADAIKRLGIVVSKNRGSSWHIAFDSRAVKACLGVYAVYDKVSGKLAYVGSGVLKERTNVWFRKHHPFFVKWRAAKKKGEHLMAEFRLIEALQPPMNVKGLYKDRLPLAARLSKDQIRNVLLKSERRAIERDQEIELSLREAAESKRKVAEMFDDLPSPPKSESA